MKPETLGTQREMLRALRQELAIKEKELADLRWVFDQFLHSPAWRLTGPIRKLANQYRNLKSIATGKPAPPGRTRVVKEIPNESPDLQTDFGLHLKSLFSSQYLDWLESFLASSSRLPLPRCSPPKVSVILVLYNRAELTFACLRTLAECRAVEIEVIIVDNASTDDTARLLDRLDGAQIIRNAENLNFLLAVNQAAKIAEGEHLLLLNNDAQLLPGSLENALRTLESGEGIGAVGAKIILLDGTLQEAGSIVWKDGSCLGYGRGDDPFSPSYMFRRDVDYCAGAFLLTPRRTWISLGGFNEAFKPAYYEETDYCMRLWENGLRVVYDPEAVIVHYEFASSSSPAKAIQLQSAHQSIFAERHKSALTDRFPPSETNLLAARSRDSGNRVLFLDDRIPHTWLGSGFPRARTMALSLVKHHYQVTLYPLSEIQEPWDVVYSDMPREIEFMTGMGPAMLEMFLRNRRGYYQTIVVSRPHNMQRLQAVIAEHPDWFEAVHIVYDAEALFTHRDAMMQELAGTPWPEARVCQALEEEIKIAASAHCIVSVSENEKAAFRKAGIQRAYVLGHAIEATPQPVDFENRHGLLFVGAIHSELSPNGDSMIWFLTEIFPRIQQQLGNSIGLTIAGVNNSERIRQLAGPSVHITGRLADIGALYAKARLFIAPTRYAAGLPHKIHEAAARGLPVVATPLLANQLGWTERELSIAGSAADFADRCVALYNDPGKWLEMRIAALERIKIECSPELFDKTIEEILGDSRRI